MGRWEPNSRGRLQEAALALYSDRGFDQTTAAEIAARAGVTERTFFRHFTDKREVLFGGSEILRGRIVSGVAEAPASDSPLEAVAHGLDAAANLLGEPRRDLTAQRQAVIAANPGLREDRELAKLADYAASVAATLRDAALAAAGDIGCRVRNVGVPRGHPALGEERRREESPRHHEGLDGRAASGDRRRLSCESHAVHPMTDDQEA